MTYVISNIHGNYDVFRKMLDTVKFSDRDNLYLLGDIVDYGEQNIELLNDISTRYNVYSIAGEHDFLALKYLSEYEKLKKSDSKPDAALLRSMTEWLEDGGQAFFDEFIKSDSDTQEGVLDYLSDMTLYEEIAVNDKDYLLIHAGIKNFSPDIDLDSLTEDDFFSEGLDFRKKYYDDKIIIAGHEPTTSENGGDGRIFYGNGSIDIDCGLMRGGVLGCLRLEDGREFYV